MNKATIKLFIAWLESADRGEIVQKCREFEETLGKGTDIRPELLSVAKHGIYRLSTTGRKRGDPLIHSGWLRTKDRQLADYGEPVKLV